VDQVVLQVIEDLVSLAQIEGLIVHQINQDIFLENLRVALVVLQIAKVLNLEDSISKVMVPMEFQLVSTVTAVEQDQVMVQEEYQ